jgi:hypothetical protein
MMNERQAATPCRPARALILALRAGVAELRARMREQQGQIQELQERLNQNSSISSRPPSTDSPTVKRRQPRRPSGRLRVPCLPA